MKRRHLVSCMLFIALVCLLVPDGLVYAAGDTITTVKNTLGQDITNFLHLLISILSRVWIFLAALAGKLMTNSIVYGEFIHLDMALRKLWNVMKNFANFAIGFLFLWTVVKAFFSPDVDAKKIFGKIVWFIAAGVAVQASWFLIGAVIDIQTILVSSMGSFPAMLMDGDPALQAAVKEQTFYIPKKVTLNLGSDPSAGPMNTIGLHGEKMQSWDEAEKAITNTGNYTGILLEDFLDMITPKHDSVAGPLIYLGVSVFHVQTYLTRTVQMPNSMDISDTLTTFFIKAGMLVFYTLAMLIFVVVNAIRVVFLRIFIAVSPILICFYILNKVKSEIGIDAATAQDKVLSDDGFLSEIGVVNALKFIFAPVLYTIYLSMMLIMVVAMQKIIISNEPIDFGSENVVIQGNSVTVGSSSFTLIGDIWPNRKSDTQTTILDILLMALTMAMLYGLVGLMISGTGSATADKAAGAVRDLGDKALENIPIGSTSVGGIKGFTGIGNGKGIEGIARDLAGKIDNKVISKQTQELKKQLGLEKGSWDEQDKTKIKNLATTSRWSGDVNGFLDTLSSQVSSKGDQLAGVVNFDKQSDVTEMIDTWLQEDAKGAGISGKNWEQLAKGYGVDKELYKEINKLSEDDKKKITNLDTFVDAIVKTNIDEAKALGRLYKKITGKEPSKPLKTTDDFMKEKRGSGSSE